MKYLERRDRTLWHFGLEVRRTSYGWSLFRGEERLSPLGRSRSRDVASSAAAAPRAPRSAGLRCIRRSRGATGREATAGARGRGGGRPRGRRHSAREEAGAGDAARRDDAPSTRRRRVEARATDAEGRGVRRRARRGVRVRDPEGTARERVTRRRGIRASWCGCPRLDAQCASRARRTADRDDPIAAGNHAPCGVSADCGSGLPGDDTHRRGPSLSH